MNHRMSAAVAVCLAALVATVFIVPAAAVDEQALIVEITQAHIGDKFRLGANGPNHFDCSGFLWFTFKTAGLEDKIGGKKRTAAQFQNYFGRLGLLYTDPKQAQVGDLAFYGKPAKHSAIVTRIDKKGMPRITSALTIGVHETKYNTLNVRFNSFAHVGLGNTDDPSPSTDASPMPTDDPISSGDPTSSGDPSSSADPTSSADPSASPQPSASL
jgi:hypothetical protein